MAKRHNTNGRLRLAIVGCGAITEQSHLPAARLAPAIELVALVDSDLNRAKRLADVYGVPRQYTDLEAVAGQADAVLVATPPHTHAPIVCQAFALGLHVLSEKPLGSDVRECDEMLAAAARAQLVFAAAHNRRFFPNRQLSLRLLHAGAIGKVRRVNIEVGGAYGWPSVTGYAFDRQMTGGGVLLDAGIHELDFLLAACPELSIENYRDDAVTGVESNAVLEFTVPTGRGRLQISRTHRLSNKVSIAGDAGSITFVSYETNRLWLASAKAPATRAAFPGEIEVWATPLRSPLQTYAAQLNDFALAVITGDDPACPAASGRATVAIVEQCYRQKRNRGLPLAVPQPGECI